MSGEGSWKPCSSVEGVDRVRTEQAEVHISRKAVATCQNSNQRRSVEDAIAEVRLSVRRDGAGTFEAVR